MPIALHEDLQERHVHGPASVVRLEIPLSKRAPLVSVVMPCRNSAAWVGHAIQSVRDQDYKDWELIVIDDASEDASGSIVADHVLQDDRISLYHTSAGLGGAGARNLGISYSRGRYLAFLDADDWWACSKLSEQLQFMEKNGIALSCTSYEKVSPAGDRDNRVFNPPEQARYHDLLQTCSIGCSTVMLDTRILGKRQFPDIKRSHDYALWLEILREGHVVNAIKKPLTFYREGMRSLSSNKLLKLHTTWKIYRDREQQDSLHSLRLLGAYAFNGIKKRLI